MNTMTWADVMAMMQRLGGRQVVIEALCDGTREYPLEWAYTRAGYRDAGERYTLYRGVVYLLGDDGLRAMWRLRPARKTRPVAQGHDPNVAGLSWCVETDGRLTIHHAGTDARWAFRFVEEGAICSFYDAPCLVLPAGLTYRVEAIVARVAAGAA